MDPQHTMPLIADVEEAAQHKGDIFDFLRGDLGKRKPNAAYKRIILKSLGIADPKAEDPKERWMYIGDTIFDKRNVKTALRTLGGRNIRLYSMGKDQPLWLMNDDNEAVIIAPAIGQTPANYIRLRDIGS